MKITNQKKINQSAWGTFSFFILIGSFFFKNTINKEWIIAIFSLSLFIFILFLQIHYIEFKSTQNNIIIKRKLVLYKKNNRVLVRIPKAHLKSYHIKEKFFSYELIMLVKNEAGTEELIKIQFFGFSWKMMIRMIKSLENAKRSGQFAGEF